MYIEIKNNKEMTGSKAANAPIKIPRTIECLESLGNNNKTRYKIRIVKEKIIIFVLVPLKFKPVLSVK